MSGSERAKVIATTGIAGFVGVLIAIVIVVSVEAAEPRALIFGLPGLAAIMNVLLWSSRRQQWLAFWSRLVATMAHVQGAVSVLLFVVLAAIAIGAVARFLMP